MTDKIEIAVAKGDGIGPEIMEAVLSIFEAAELPFRYQYVEMGKAVFEQGITTGITPKAKEVIERVGILFKGPMETPKGKGVKSINVTARKVWNTYANVRKFRTFQGVDTIFSQAGIPINITLLRENVEGCYGGIEYMQTPDVAVGYRLITRPGTRQLMHFAFDYADKNGIQEIICGHKANIMKITDGLFMDTFYEVAKDYPHIKAGDLLVDDMAMKLVRHPERFQMVVLSNLQGDILSDLCAGLVGGLGFAPSANIGDYISIFEAVHGTAPDIAGKGIANPCSLLLSGLMMLRHVGLNGDAARIEAALMATLEEGIHTGDFGNPDTPASTTAAFAQAVIEHIPTKTKGKDDTIYIRPARPQHLKMLPQSQANQSIYGFDFFIQYGGEPEELAQLISGKLPLDMTLEIIANRGTQIWPESSVYTDCVAHYQARIKTHKNNNIEEDMIMCYTNFSQFFDIVDIEILRIYDGQRGFSLIQGE